MAQQQQNLEDQQRQAKGHPAEDSRTFSGQKEQKFSEMDVKTSQEEAARDVEVEQNESQRQEGPNPRH